MPTGNIDPQELDAEIRRLMAEQLAYLKTFEIKMEYVEVKRLSWRDRLTYLWRRAFA